MAEKDKAREALERLDRKPEELAPRRRFQDLMPDAKPAPTGPAPQPTTRAAIESAPASRRA